MIHYELPLNEIIYDFFDMLKSKHARLRFARLRAQGLRQRRDLVRLDMLLNGETCDALSIHRPSATRRMRAAAASPRN